MNVEIYCNCHKNFGVNKLNQIYQKNLMLNGISYSVDEKSKFFKEGFIFDDTGENISHLNNWFGQLTGVYWAWKNAEADVVGSSVYRIFWSEDELKNGFEKNTLYIPTTLDVKKCVADPSVEKNNIYDHFSYCHGSTALDFMNSLVIENQIPIQKFMIDKLKADVNIHAFNMFICEKNLFDKICSLLFEALFPVYTLYRKENLYEKRILDFLGERVLHMIFTNHTYYFNNLKIKTIPITILEKNII